MAEHWGTRLKNTLKDRHVSQRQAAKHAAVAPSVINGWLSGVSPTNYLAVKKLADALDVSFTWLMTGEKESGTQGLKQILATTEFQSIFDGIARIKIEKIVEDNR